MSLHFVPSLFLGYPLHPRIRRWNEREKEKRKSNNRLLPSLKACPPSGQIQLLDFSPFKSPNPYVPLLAMSPMVTKLRLAPPTKQHTHKESKWEERERVHDITELWLTFGTSCHLVGHITNIQCTLLYPVSCKSFIHPKVFLFLKC